MQFFRLTQKHIIAFNFLIITAIAYFAARSLDQIILQSLESAPVPSRFAIGHSGAQVHSRVEYDQISKRDVFNLVPQEAAPVVTTVDLHLKLLGTSLGTRDPYAIIEDQSGEQSLYTIGDQIPDAGRVVSIQKTRIVVQNGAQQIAVDIPDDDLPAGIEMPRLPPQRVRRRGGDRPDRGRAAVRNRPALAPRNTRALAPHPAAAPKPEVQKPEGGDDNDDNDVPDVDVEETSDNHYAVKRDDLKEALNHSQQLFQQIHAIPLMQNGKMAGVTLSEIEPGSVFEDLGLQDDDQLTAIDGRPIENPAEAAGLLSTLESRSALDLTVKRDGEPVQLHYDIN